MRKGALFLLLGATPLFASTDVVQGFPDKWRCARGDYSDQCLYVDRTSRPVREVVQARVVRDSGACVMVTAYGQSWCDDRRRDEPQQGDEKPKEGGPK